MQINITGDNVQLTEAIRNYVNEKFERLTRRGDNITNIRVVFGVEKVNQIAKATLHLAGLDIHASSESTDLYSAIDNLVDKLSHQITKHKEKMKDHHRDENG